MGEDVRHFIDDEAGLRSWVSLHPAGYVIALEHSPWRRTLVLHLATCDRLAGPGPRHGRTDYVCSDRAVALELWAHETFREFPRPCADCRPGP